MANFPNLNKTMGIQPSTQTQEELEEEERQKEKALQEALQKMHDHFAKYNQ